MACEVVRGLTDLLIDGCLSSATLTAMEEENTTECSCLESFERKDYLVC